MVIARVYPRMGVGTSSSPGNGWSTSASVAPQRLYHERNTGDSTSAPATWMAPIRFSKKFIFHLKHSRDNLFSGNSHCSLLVINYLILSDYKDLLEYDQVIHSDFPKWTFPVPPAIAEFQCFDFGQSPTKRLCFGCLRNELIDIIFLNSGHCHFKRSDRNRKGNRK